MDDLIELERRGWASLCDGTGDAFYGTTMTEDAVMVLADGSVMSRHDVVAANSPSFVGVMTSVYVRRDGQWKLAVYQQTPTP